ncbi:transcription initiation factor TFIID subunit, partial [Reticulomyxa filosa]
MTIIQTITLNVFIICENLKEMEDQFLLRLPTSVSEKIRSQLKSNEGSKAMIFDPVSTSASIDTQQTREFNMQFDGEIYKGILCDLPCIIETQKTFNKQLYFKCGDISQMLTIFDNDQSNNDTTNTQYELDSGLAPPSAHIKDRWNRIRPVCQCSSAVTITTTTTTTTTTTNSTNVTIFDHCTQCHGLP